MKNVLVLMTLVVSASAFSNDCLETDRQPNSVCFKKIQKEFEQVSENRRAVPDLSQIQGSYEASCFYEKGSFFFGDSDKRKWIGVVNQNETEAQAHIQYPNHAKLPADGDKVVLVHATGSGDSLVRAMTSQYYSQDALSQISAGVFKSREHITYHRNGSVDEAADVRIKISGDSIFYQLRYSDGNGELLCKAFLHKQ